MLSFASGASIGLSSTLLKMGYRLGVVFLTVLIPALAMAPIGWSHSAKLGLQLTGHEGLWRRHMSHRICHRSAI
jgi:hypothetical protein